MFITKTKKIAAVLSVIAATGLFFSCGDKIDKSTPEAYFKSVMSKKVETVSGDMEKELGAYSDLMNNGLSAKGDISFELGKRGKDLLNLAGASMGISAEDLAWFKNLKFTVDMSKSKQNFSMNSDIKLNNAHIAFLNFLVDFENPAFFVKIPELYEKFIFGNDSYTMNSIQNAFKNQFENIPDMKITKQVIDEATAALLKNISGVERAESVISVSGEKTVESTYDALKLTLTKENAEAMVSSLKEYLSTSQAFDELLKWAEEQYGRNQDKESGINEIADNLKELFGQLENAVVTIYPDKKGELAGIELSKDEDAFKLNTVLNGSDYGLELSFKQDNHEIFNLSGTGIYNNKRVSGNFFGKVYNERTRKLTDAFDVSTKNISFSNIFDYGSEKEVAVTLKTDFLRNIVGLNREESAMVSNFTYLIKGSSSSKDGKGSFSITDSELEPYASVVYDLKINKASAVNIPAETDSVDVNSADFYGVIGDIKFNTIIENLNTAGVPKQYTDLLGYYAK